jgi:hypothetical protein
MDKLKFRNAIAGVALIALLAGCTTTTGTTSSDSDQSGSSATSTGSDESSGSESSDDSESVTSIDWTDYVTAELVEFSVSNAECSYSDGSLELLVTLTNVSDKKIIAVDASATVNDVFGEEINRYSISGDKSFGPGKQLNVGSWGNSCYDLNKYSSEDQRLLDMEDLDTTTDVVIKVSKIAFEGGEVLEF